jgi:hypothetical protein
MADLTLGTNLLSTNVVLKGRDAADMEPLYTPLHPAHRHNQKT